MGALMTQEKYYSVREIAQLFQITERTVRDMINEGQIEAVRVGGQYRISQGALDEYIRRNSSRKRQGD